MKKYILLLIFWIVLTILLGRSEWFSYGAALVVSSFATLCVYAGV